MNSRVDRRVRVIGLFFEVGKGEWSARTEEEGFIRQEANATVKCLFRKI